MDLENQGLEEYSDFKDRNKITNGRLQEIRFLGNHHERTCPVHCLRLAL
ncbi:MAG: hypothetical protein WBJ00_05000 [Dethiobacteria bacterium]|jgi:hypothetical protein|nr:hypothetical protein [Bacillota bacterium]HPT34162.1 hypothetical protein [Bacillota bacterium]